MASHLCHRNEKQSLLIGVKRVIKSQGTCQNTQFVTWKSCQLVSSHNPTPKKVIAILKQSRGKSQHDSEGMRNSHTLGPTAGIYPWTSWSLFSTTPALPVQTGCTERPQHHRMPTGKVSFWTSTREKLLLSLRLAKGPHLYLWNKGSCDPSLYSLSLPPWPLSCTPHRLCTRKKGREGKKGSHSQKSEKEAGIAECQKDDLVFLKANLGLNELHFFITTSWLLDQATRNCWNEKEFSENF